MPAVPPAPTGATRRRVALLSDEGKDGHSIFAWNLVRTLGTAGGLMPGYEVWQHVHRGVTAEYPQQPQYGAVVSAGHMDGGDFLFQPQ